MELETRLWRPKFDRYLTMESRKLLLHDFRSVAIWVDIPPAIGARQFCRDADDDKFLHLALAGAVQILSPADALALLG